jgi:hypothetical protein
MIRMITAFALLLTIPMSPVIASEPTNKSAAVLVEFNDPLATVEAIYSDDAKQSAKSLPMTQRLESLFLLERDHLEASGEPIGRLDFDWTVNGQDASISMVDVTAVDVPLRDFGDAAVDQFERRIVTARFMNFDNEQVIRYYWVKQRNGWHLDDVTGQGEDSMTWTLSLLLGYGG